MGHPIKCQGRAQFIACQSDYWSVAKKTGNLYVRDFDHTYTIIPVLVQPETMHIHPEFVYRAVVVGAGGAREDVGPYDTREELFDALWPESFDHPIGASK
jgi:hypothetical protein